VTPAELNQEWEAGKFRPVYYFYGPEDYRIKEAEKSLVKKFLPKSQAGINHSILSGARQSLSEILSELAVFPMLGERQVFTITDIQSLTPDEIEKVFALLHPPDPNRIVVLISPSDKTPKKNTKTFKLLSGKTGAVEFNRLSDALSIKRIKGMLGENQITIDEEAENILAVLGDGNMGGLIEEINKLINYIGPGGKVTREDIARICSDYQVFDIYELANAAARGERDRALQIINFYLKEGERTSGILFWLGDHFADLYLIKNRKAVAGWKQTRTYYLDALRAQAGFFENEALEKIIELLSDADNDLRHNIRPESMILERLIINICNLAAKK
jgi:DNA polymerase III subunit delta